MAGSNDDGPVGYKRPPRHSQFQKGRSGNPRGRPRGSGVRSAMEKLLDRTVTATIDGERCKVPLTEALVLQLAQRALAGDIPARREILKIADQVQEARVETSNAKEKLTQLVRRYVDPMDCNPALEKLGVITGVSGRYKIEPWVVEAALARGVELTNEDRALVSNGTRRPGERLTEEHEDDFRMDGRPSARRT